MTSIPALDDHVAEYQLAVVGFRLNYTPGTKSRRLRYRKMPEFGERYLRLWAAKHQGVFLRSTLCIDKFYDDDGNAAFIRGEAFLDVPDREHRRILAGC